MGAEAAPALERLGEGEGRGVAEALRHLGERQIGAFQQADGVIGAQTLVVGVGGHAPGGDEAAGEMARAQPLVAGQLGQGDRAVEVLLEMQARPLQAVLGDRLCAAAAAAAHLAQQDADMGGEDLGVGGLVRDQFVV